MVAISAVYKGNLHKVPTDVPRKWLMPSRQISLKDFKTLLRRRSRAALSRLPQLSPTPNPNPDPNFRGAAHDNNNDNNNDSDNEMVNNNDKNACAEIIIAQTKEAPNDKEEEEDEIRVEEEGLVGDQIGSGASETLVLSDEVALEKNDLNAAAAAVERGQQQQQQHEVTEQEDEKKNEQQQEEVPLLLNPTAPQTTSKEDEESDKYKRKKEVEEKLKILKEKKHGLVQVLKQIQNAEEELKRRSSGQGMAVCPSVPLQVDIPTDTGSMTRLNTPRVGSDGTLGGEVDGGENDGMLNHNPDARHLLRMSSSSPSPSSDSQPKKPAYNVVPNPARASLGVSSPSRFAPTGQQGLTSNLPTVSVSGTNYVASSPSPAASGGTSVFRESRVPSPWN
ncbi:uncharacterized protein [Coffea arabica]|uniref:Uncharacterized protein n=1 Tax=Coffea arabica TaxID=13443 RepID=A0A6P6X754_COFAR|nr:serine/threonine-protein kinase pakA-like [Coffea arabica]